MHDNNGIPPVSLLLTVNIFPTFSNSWLWTGKCLPGSYWKDKHFWRVYYALCCSLLKFITKLHLNLYLQNPSGKSVRNFCKVYFRLWFWLKRCGSYSKWVSGKLPPVRVISVRIRAGRQVSSGAIFPEPQNDDIYLFCKTN